MVWGRKHKDETGTNLNSYLVESTVNFMRSNYAYSRLELVDKDELFPQAAVHPSYRIGGVHVGRRARSGAEPYMATRTGSGRNVLLQARSAGIRLWNESNLVPGILARASGIDGA